MHQDKYITPLKGRLQFLVRQTAEVERTLGKLIQRCAEDIKENQAGIDRCDRALGRLSHG